MKTIDDWLRDSQERLKAAGLDSPRLDARILMQEATGLNATGLITQATNALSQEQSECFRSMIARRIAREPVARIVGHKEFWGLTFRLSAATLVPRPDTETVVEAVLTHLKSVPPDKRPDSGLTICDLGTGSGAILLALLSELQEARGLGLDISESAIATARRNAGALGLSARADFQVADFGLAEFEPVTVLVSNPPYIETGAIADLDPEVSRFDPPVSLDGGPDGLAAYRTIAGRLDDMVHKDGLVAVEVGMGQSEAVEKIFWASGRERTICVKDLAGIDRVVLALP